MPRRGVLLALVWVGVACSAPLEVTGGPDPTPIFRAYAIPPYTDAVPLCDGNVVGTDGSEITWDALTAYVPPSELMTFYLNQLGSDGLERDKEGGAWRLPPGEPDRTLTVSEAHGSSSFHLCPDKQVPSDARSFIELSRRSD